MMKPVKLPVKYEKGFKFGEWEIQEPITSITANRKVTCSCSCGIIKPVHIVNLLSGASTRCHACKSKELIKYEDGFVKSALYHMLSVHFTENEMALIYDYAVKNNYNIQKTSVCKIDPYLPYKIDNFIFTETMKKGSSKSRKWSQKAYLVTINGKKSWQCSFFDDEGKRHTKSFSLRKYGEEEAKRLAEEYWDDLLAKLITARVQIAKQQGLDVFWEKLK